MSLKSTAKKSLLGFIHLPVVSQVVFHPPVRRVLEKLPGTWSIYAGGWGLKHPFDLTHGTDTSGFVAGEDLLTGDAADAYANPYCGSQPAVQRAALAKIPRLENCTFVDLGCGKGRPLLVASEFPFKDIVGVELTPSLAEIARKNATIVSAQFAERTRVRVEEGDASIWPLPAGDVVLFQYNAFQDTLVEKLVMNVESAIAADPSRSIYVVYYNPVCGDCFDRSSALIRRFAGMLGCAQEEIGYGPSTEEAVVIWQGGAAPPPESRADDRIVVAVARWHCVLESPEN